MWRNDDRGGSVNALFPLIKANTGSGQRGWYTLQVSRWNGAPPYADFTFAYGRYNAGNPNCATPTSPAMVAQAEAVKRHTPMAAQEEGALPGGTAAP